MAALSDFPPPPPPMEEKQDMTINNTDWMRLYALVQEQYMSCKENIGNTSRTQELKILKEKLEYMFNA